MSSHVTQVHSGEGTGEDLQLRTALIDSMTHDFRTPLTSIKAAVTALLTDSRVRPAQRSELLSIISEEADRLNRLVGNAVEASRLGVRVKLDLGAHTIASILNGAKADCKTLLGKRPLAVQLEPGLPAVRADLKRAKKALVQLLENAINYSPPNAPITIKANLKGNFVTISVADRGGGIEDFEQELIFERFYRGKGHRALSKGPEWDYPSQTQLSRPMVAH